MPFDIINIGPGRPVLGRHISDLYAGLTGLLTDQAITLGHNLTVWGVTMLSRDPTQPLEAATKQYVDAIEMTPGPRGSLWYSATGDPTVDLPGAIDKDHYLDTVTGDVWIYDDPQGTPYGEGPYGAGPYGGTP